MDKKKIITLVVFLIIIIGTVSAIVIFNKKDANDEKEPTNSDKRVNETLKSEITEFPKNDKSVKGYLIIDYLNNCKGIDATCKYIDQNINFKNQKITNGNLTVETKCDDYLNDETEKNCQGSTLKIDNLFEVTTTLGRRPTKREIVIAKTDDYYIIEDVNVSYNTGTLSIYDKKGKVVKKIENVVADFLSVEKWKNEQNYERDYNDFEFTISDNKLYYVTTDDYKDYMLDTDKYIQEDLCQNYVHFNYIDLKNLETKELSKTCAHTGQLFV